MLDGVFLFTVLVCIVLDASFSNAFVANDGNRRCRWIINRPHRMDTSSTSLSSMKRPVLDQLASFLFRLENDRVVKSTVVDDMGRSGEPMEWSESDSLANRFSTIVASNSLGYRFKQFVADIVAGDDYDVEQVNARIDNFVSDNPVAMFSFTTCPFCRRAKDLLDEKGVPYEVIELDELEGNAGNEIRANLGRKTGRTSVPSIFIGGNYIGGCNDGPGLLPLEKSGELDVLLQEVL
eukprot:jgi/Psemu1/303111/fgenesh1_kg.92_\